MNAKQIMDIFNDTAYVRMGGSAEELKCAEYIKAKCEEMGVNAHLENFEVDMSYVLDAQLIIDGESIPCKGYRCAGNAEIEAPLYYMPDNSQFSLSQCKGKIVMIDGYLGYWMYHDLLDNGAVGFITYDGNANYVDEDIDDRELRTYVSQGNIIPGVNINAKKAISIVEKGAKTAKIILKQNEYKGESRNVVADIPGEIDEYIVLTAHYDSTSLSQGAYDNMSGSVGLLGIAEYFTKHPHRYGLRFVWCGSEERGLLGSKAYTAQHETELGKIAFNINLDMIGCIMGKFIACCTCESSLVDYIKYFGSEKGFAVSCRQDVYSSDSTPFADKGVPSLSFARLAPPNTATIHNSYDTAALMSGEQMAKDIDFIVAFTERMANAQRCPVGRDIPQNIKDKLDIYLCRKRDEKR